MRFSPSSSWFGFFTLLTLAPVACGDESGGTGSSASDTSVSEASSTSGVTTGPGSSGAAPTTGGAATEVDDPTASPTTTTSDATTSVVTATAGSTTAGSTTGDSTTDGSTGDTTTGDTTTTTGDASTGEGSTTGIGGEDNVLYVRDDGQDGNPGTVESPLRTIQWALVKAQQQPGIDTIRVAEGDYAIDYANDDHIVMVEGVSLYGGYRADWGARDPAEYVTHIVDASPSAVPSSETNPHRAIELPAGLTAATVLDGFHVRVARGEFRAAVFVRGGATLRNNILEPVVAPGAVVSYGARIYQAHPILVANRIRFDVVESLGQSMGISATLSNGLFADNVIDMSGVLNNAYGMWLSAGAAKVLGNSVYASDGNNTHAIYLISSATPTLDNNLLVAEDAAAICVFSSGGSAVPNLARNNVLGCHYTLFGNSPLRMWTTVAEFEGGLANAADNVKPPQLLVQPDNDLMLDAESLCTVTQGGRDITADVPLDIDGLARTAPLSIGAHEWDGTCQ